MTQKKGFFKKLKPQARRRAHNIIIVCLGVCFILFVSQLTQNSHFLSNRYEQKNKNLQSTVNDISVSAGFRKERFELLAALDLYLKLFPQNKMRRIDTLPSSYSSSSASYSSPAGGSSSLNFDFLQNKLLWPISLIFQIELQKDANGIALTFRGIDKQRNPFRRNQAVIDTSGDTGRIRWNSHSRVLQTELNFAIPNPPADYLQTLVRHVLSALSREQQSNLNDVSHLEGIFSGHFIYSREDISNTSRTGQYRYTAVAKSAWAKKLFSDRVFSMDEQLRNINQFSLLDWLTYYWQNDPDQLLIQAKLWEIHLLQERLFNTTGHYATTLDELAAFLPFELHQGKFEILIDDQNSYSIEWSPTERGVTSWAINESGRLQPIKGVGDLIEQITSANKAVANPTAGSRALSSDPHSPQIYDATGTTTYSRSQSTTSTHQKEKTKTDDPLIIEQVSE